MKRIGIAFGAGGARGIAHLLMIEALEELGVKPSIISGSSIGEIVGAFYAAGFTSKEMREILNQLINPKSDSVFDFLLKSDIVKLFTMFDPQFIKSGFIKGEKFQKYMQTHLKVNKFEDLKNKLKSFQGFDELIVKDLEYAKLKLFHYPAEDMDVIYHLSSSIAHFNKTYLKKGLDNIEEELNQMVSKPDQFLSMMKTYLFEPSEELLKTMFSVTEEFVCKKCEEKQPDLEGFYEEFKSRYNKIYGETNFVKRHMFIHAIIKEIKNFFMDNACLTLGKACTFPLTGKNSWFNLHSAFQ